MANEVFVLPPLLLVGASGSGKTRYARRLAELAMIPTATLIAAGATDNKILSGTARGWASANPAFPLETIRRVQVANPLIIVEELDKAGGSDRNGRLADTLLSMLDPNLSANWLDDCLQAPVDLSWISWVMTANRLDLIRHRFGLDVGSSISHHPVRATLPSCSMAL